MVEIVYTEGIDFYEFALIGKVYRNIPIKVKKEIADALVKKSLGFKYVVTKEDKVFKEE